MKKSLSLLFSMGCCAWGNFLLPNSASAQITEDGTTNTAVNANGDNFTIENGDRAGSNLFHSFQDFSVPNEGSAVFNNAADIENIFSRVTGGNVSNINGLIQANDANLFLINPAGIMFGVNGRLDIGGSFLGTTADSILFDDGEFSATNFDSPPLLTVNAPIGLNFRDRPGSITNLSVSQNLDGETNITGGSVGLQVTNGKTLALIGGDILLDDGNLTAKAGHIEIGSVLGEGEIGISETDIGFVFDYESINSFGDIMIQNTAIVDVTDANEGSINVIGNDFVLDNSSLNSGIAIGLGSPNSQAGDTSIKTNTLTLNNSALIRNTTSGIGNAGNVSIETQELKLSSSDIITEVADFDGIGNAGDINIVTNSLSLENGSAFLADTENQGNAGNITIEAEDSVTISGIGENTSPSQITSTVDAGSNADVTGNAGNIEINTGSLSVTDGGFISASTFGLGNGGKITINATDLVSLGNEDSSGQLSTNIESGATGNSEGVEINTNSFSASNSSQIQSQVEGQGDSGKIIVNAQETVSFDGRDRTNTNPSAAFSRVLQGGNGNPGGIEINANSLSISNRAQLSSTLAGIGAAGDIVINTNEEVSLSNSIIISEVSDLGGAGDGGDISITSGSLFLRDGSSLLADTENQGNAGNIIINAREQVVLEGEGQSAVANSEDTVFSRISTMVESNAMGESGIIDLSTNQLSIDGGFISSSTFGMGNAANINILAKNLSLTNGGQISSFTSGSGNGSTININVSDIIALDGKDRFGFNSGLFSTIEQEGTGEAGNINISTRDLFLSDSAEINVAAFGQGNAGNIFVEATDSISLSNQGSISASNQGTIKGSDQSSEGGIIELQISNNLLLRDNSLISAQAFNNANGGNLTIDTSFIVAFPEGNNDIVANAEQGEGGVININAESLLGIQERPLNDSTNDINASSEDSRLDGNITINTSDINPIQGATELPSNLVVPEQNVAQACAASQNTSQANSLVVRGKGGVPTLPTATLSSEIITINNKPINNSSYVIPTSQGNVIPARGVVKKANGNVVLTAFPIAKNAIRLPNNSINCG